MDVLRFFPCVRYCVSGSIIAALILELLGLGVFGGVPLARAAVVIIDDNTSTTARTNNSTGAQTVFITDQTGYAFYRDRNGGCVYSKSTDAGATWSSAVVVDAQSDCIRIVVWYDGWTPDDTGSNIHILTMDTNTDSLFYNRLDTSTDTRLLGTSPINISSPTGQVTTFSSAANLQTLTKGTDGVLYAAVTDNQPNNSPIESYVLRCTANCNTGSNWVEAGTNPLDNSPDPTLLLPLDNDDIMLINRDVSANTLRSKIWDGSSWSSTWTTIDSGIAESTEYDGGMSGMINHSNGHIYLAYVTDHNFLNDNNDDIKTAVYDGSSWSQMANVLSNATGRGIVDVSLAIDQNNGNVYAAYTVQDTGGTASSANIYWQRSTDAMTSWGGEEGPVNTTAGDIRKPALDPSNTERLYVTWWEAATDDRFGETLDNIGPDTVVSTTGSQVTLLRAERADLYVGGAIAISSLFTNTLSSITVTATGTNAVGAAFENVKLFYELDITSPYNCESESYAGTEVQFGATATDGFAADGTVTFGGAAVIISPTATFCGYVITDTTRLAPDGETFTVQITDPTVDIGVTGSDAFPASPVAITGTTALVGADVTQTNFHWRSDNGSETTATSLTGGAENTRFSSLTPSGQLRLRVGVSNEGSVTSDSGSFQLQFAEAATTCDLVTGWVAVGAASDAFAMFDSSNLTHGSDTTNIAVGSGGITDADTNFRSPNSAVLETSDTSGSYTLTTNDFVELEYSLTATASAVEGNTYCFRLVKDNEPLIAYTNYPQVTINADVSVAAIGTQAAALTAPSTGQYLGGTFAIRSNAVSQTISSLTLTEIGTIDAQNLTNVSLFYDLDTSSPYNCASESYAGTESQFGATDANGFPAANGSSTFSGSLTITTEATACVYVVADVADGVRDGQTIELQIDSPAADVAAGGASVSPSTPVALVGATVIEAAELTQGNYHWRNDDGSETGATSYTNGTQNTAIDGFDQTTPVRLRMGVHNAGSATAPSTVYQLQFAEQVGSCSALANTWIAVNAVAGDEWDMNNSVNLTHNEATTNIAIADGGIADREPTFVGIDGVRESSASTSAISLAADTFIEYEFSLTSTNATAFEATYCFRLVANNEALEGYEQYPQIIMSAKQDFKTQRGTTVLTGLNTTITAGADYTPPAATGTAFIRITNTHHTGAGDINGGGSQDVEEVTAYIQNPDNLDTSITFTRDINLNETRIDWEIIEFIGRPTTDNEMIVRDVGVVSVGLGDTTVAGPSVTIADDADVVVFITGIGGDDTANDFHTTQFTSDWNETLDVPEFTRAATLGVTAFVSYAVVEYTGFNWQIDRVEHVYTQAGTTETASITAVPALSQTFLHPQKRMTGNSLVASHGHEVFMSSIGAVSFRLAADADMTNTHTGVAWVIANTQTGPGAMKVERQSGSMRGGSEPLLSSLSISDTLSAVSNASIFGSSAADGTNNAHPRSIAGLKIINPTTYAIWRSDTGETLYYQVELVQWPIADLQYQQSYYRWYDDNDQLTPSDPWPAGAVDLGENTSITDLDKPPGVGDVLRLRMSIEARNANLPEDFVRFTLQFAERVTTCSAVATWSDVGGTAASTIWRGHASTNTTDGDVLSTDPPTSGELLLSVSDVAGTLEQQNDTASNTYRVFDGEEVEYDWYLENNGAAIDTPYCFRMVERGGTPLRGYLHYPQLRTADFSPAIGEWRWYQDSATETPVQPRANPDTAPTDIGASSTLALRIVVPETKNVEGVDTKFALQVSTLADFSSADTLNPIGTCTLADPWCYDTGAVSDNTLITTALLASADSCSSSVGSGCGRHNSAGAYVTGHTHTASAAQEYSFTISPAALRPNIVYYFRLYDVGRGRPVSLANGASYPSLVSDGANLTFTINGVPSGTTTAGVTTTASTTADGVRFGSIPLGSDVIAAQRLVIDTNATDGYRVYKYARSGLIDGRGNSIANITSTNNAPAGWASACSSSGTGCVGYHTTDGTLSGGSTRFAPTDAYAALHTTPQEIMYSAQKTVDTHDVVYRASVTALQPAGEYATDVAYIAAPAF